MKTQLLKLNNKMKVGFELNIIGYEFENIDDDMINYDKNWLLIEMNIQKSNNRLTKIDPCLLTFEIKEIIEWFENIKENPQEGIIQFLEPNLSFRVFKNDNQWYIEPILQAEFDIKSNLGHKDLWFPLNQFKIEESIENLNNSLLEYIVRT